jgi:allantoin racemase
VAVLIINPNSTAAMTEAMVATARAVEPRLDFEGWTSHEGPPSIQGAEDGCAATPPLMELVRQAAEQAYSGIIIGCFDDTALRDASKTADCPVVGLGQAAFHRAALRNWRFSVVTTLPVSIPVIEGNISDLGLDRYLGRVRASDVPVLDLETDPRKAERAIVEEAQHAVREDGIDALILGCAGMVHVRDAVSRAVTVTVIDPVVAAARCMAWLSGP